MENKAAGQEANFQISVNKKEATRNEHLLDVYKWLSIGESKSISEVS